MDCFLYDTDLRDEGVNHTGPKGNHPCLREQTQIHNLLLDTAF